MSKHNDIYNILGKLEALQPKEQPTKAEDKKAIYESVAARGSVLEGVGKVERQLTEKFAGFDVSESGLQAYLGKKKYGEQGMKALQKAGRDGASKEKMAQIRARHDKMDESNPTDPNTWQGPDAGGAFPGQKVWPKGKRPGMYNTQTGKVSHWDDRTDTEREKSWDSMIEGGKPHPKELEMDAKVRSMGIQQRADKAEKNLAAKRAEPKTVGQKIAKDIGGPLKKLAKGDIRGALSEEPNEEMLSTKDKKFASLAEPKDKITYADKIAGAKKKTEGNKFTGNLMKARAQGKKEADLDGDGDMEKVREGWDDMMKAAKERSGPQPSGGSGIKAGRRYGGAAQKDDEGDAEPAADNAPKKKGRPKKDKFAESELNEFNLGGIAKKVAGVAKGVTQGVTKGIGKAAKAINSPIGNANVRPNDNWLARYGRRVSDGQGFVKNYVDHRTGKVVYTPKPGTERMNESDVFEKAPPGAKAERMVKHIKKGYAKDSKVTPKEKGIAYATAWKAHNKGKLAESVIYEGGDPQLDHILNRFKNEVKRFQAGDELDDDLYMALYDYYMDQGEIPYGVAKARDGDPYQWVEDRLASYIGIEEGNVISLEAPKGPANPAFGRDVLSPAEKLAPHAGVGKGPIGKAIGSAVTTAKNVGRFIQGKPEIPTLEDRELNELARLAGLSEAKKCNSTMEGKSCPVHGLKECGSMNEAKPDFLDLDKDGNKKESMKKASKEKVDECSPGTMSPMSNMGQDEGSLSVNTSMNSDGTKSVSVNATGNQADALAQMLKMAGIGGSYSAKTSDETVEEERDIEYANTPEEEMETVDAIMHQGQDLHREKKQYADRPKAGDNPMATPTRESIEMPKKISKMLEGIKKIEKEI